MFSDALGITLCFLARTENVRGKTFLSCMWYMRTSYHENKLAMHVVYRNTTVRGLMLGFETVCKKRQFQFEVGNF